MWPEKDRHLRFFIKNLEEIISSVLLSFMALLAFCNVLFRYIFNFPLAFTEEIEVGLLVWLTVFGAAAAFKRSAHLSMSFFVKKLPERQSHLFSLFSLFLTLALFCLLIYFSLIQISEERGLKITSEALGLPQWIYTAGIPVGSVFIIIRAAESALKKTP